MVDERRRISHLGVEKNEEKWIKIRKNNIKAELKIFLKENKS